MQFPTISTRKGAICSLHAALIWLVLGCTYVQAQESEESKTLVADQADDTTIVYGEEFFAQYPNAVSALDIINRIPAGQRIIQTGSNSARGFSANEDRILINGRRFTGKSNDSQSALERIARDRIARIEIIRGSSPDIKTSSQESLINIVLRDSENASSGSWKIDSEYVRGMDAALGGLVSYGGKSGNVDYQLSFKRQEQRRNFDLYELHYIGEDVLEQIKSEHDKISYGVDSATASLAFRPNDRHTFQLNGSYADWDVATRAKGLLADATGAEIGNTERYTSEDLPEWEIGADYEIALSDNTEFKILGLATDTWWSMIAGEDFLIEGGIVEDDFQFDIQQRSREAILRPSIKWGFDDRHRYEAGFEIAVNTLSSNFNYYARENGALTPIAIPGSNTRVEEDRKESYLLYVFTPNQKISTEFILAAEHSTITQTGETSRSRNFLFIKPGVDIRYDYDSSQQFQFSIKMDVEQLNFGDFAASADIDNNVFSGNTELVPEKKWMYKLSYEKRFANDAGRLVVSGTYEDIEDKIELIPLIDGSGKVISAVGNVGDARFMQLIVESSLRLAKLKLPNVVVEPRLILMDHELVDPFTGQAREFDFRHSVFFRVGLRHDVTDWGLSYGGVVGFGDDRIRFDYDEIARHNEVTFSSFFAEYNLGSSITLRIEANDLTNFDRGRDRHFYADGVAGGSVTSRVLVEHREGRVYNLSLRGAF
jgi:outer membrane receptor for ferrienterochelin and colicins